MQHNIIVKDGHFYYFRFYDENYRNLFYTWLHYGRDPELNLTLTDAAELIRSFGKKLQAKQS